MARDKPPTSSPISAVNSPSKTNAASPPGPAKHKRFSLPLFHHGDDIEKANRKATPPPQHGDSKPEATKTHRASSATIAASTAASGIPKRPTMGEMNRQNSVQTRYMTMLLHLDEIPRLHNILASFFTWILLAGFVIFPGTFTSLQSGKYDDKAKTASAAALLRTVKHIPLLVIASLACLIGAVGMLALWHRWRTNYVWLVNRIFLPGALNSFAGLISTLVNVYTQQEGAWSLTAKVTAGVTGGCMAVTAGLLVWYNMWYLDRIRKDHTRTWGGGQVLEEEEGEVKMPLGVLGKI